MKSLFNPAEVAELQQRLALLEPGTPAQWGRMTAAQMLWHCVEGFKLSSGELRPRRALMGLLLGRFIKPRLFANDDPFLRNAPTVAQLKTASQPDFEQQRKALAARITRFAADGPSAVGSHPHAFFGHLTTAEWGILAFKHLDHHFRQFNG